MRPVWVLRSLSISMPRRLASPLAGHRWPPPPPSFAALQRCCTERLLRAHAANPTSLGFAGASALPFGRSAQLCRRARIHSVPTARPLARPRQLAARRPWPRTCCGSAARSKQCRVGVRPNAEMKIVPNTSDALEHPFQLEGNQQEEEEEERRRWIVRTPAADADNSAPQQEELHGLQRPLPRPLGARVRVVHRDSDDADEKSPPTAAPERMLRVEGQPQPTQQRRHRIDAWWRRVHVLLVSRRLPARPARNPPYPAASSTGWSRWVLCLRTSVAIGSSG
jgi:hypothetical protein